MHTRNLILNLMRANRLEISAPDIPEHERELIFRDIPGVMASISAPDIFEFVWHDHGILLDEDDLTHYPLIEHEEYEEGLKCPLPHPHIWLEGDVNDPKTGLVRKYIWDIRRVEDGAFTAIPLVFDGTCLTHFGVLLKVWPNEVGDDGRPGPIGTSTLSKSYHKLYDIEEFADHARMIVRFLRILCLPQAEKHVSSPNPRANANRARRKREPISIQTTVKISQAFVSIKYRNDVPGTHASPRAHARRSHIRRLSDGRVITVKECIVGARDPSFRPTPQSFRVV